MFQYDDSVLASKIWDKYTQALELIVRLEAELEVASLVVSSFQEGAVSQGDGVDYKQSFVDEVPSLHLHEVTDD